MSSFPLSLLSQPLCTSCTHRLLKHKKDIFNGRGARTTKQTISVFVYFTQMLDGLEGAALLMNFFRRAKHLINFSAAMLNSTTNEKSFEL